MSGKVRFNSYRLIGLLIYFVSITTIIGYFVPTYFSFFNLYPNSEDIFGPMTTLLFFVLLLLLSLVILFKFSYSKLLKGGLAAIPSFALLKNFIPDISFARNSEEETTSSVAKAKSTDTKVAKVTAKAEKKQKEFENMILKLKAEKEELQKQKALEKQQKQLGLKDATKKIKVEKRDKDK